jgi:hypothetical protein
VSFILPNLVLWYCKKTERIKPLPCRRPILFRKYEKKTIKIAVLPTNIPGTKFELMMKKTALIYGSLIGIIFISGALYMTNLLFYKNPEIEGNDFLGYVVIIIIYSLLFFGVRNYRNRYLNGVISFKKAFKTGALIALVASTVYVVVWLFYYYLFAPDFMDKYTEYVLLHAAPAELEEKTQMMNNYKTMYENPLFVILMSYAEILPPGLVFSLISSLILKKKKQ